MRIVQTDDKFQSMTWQLSCDCAWLTVRLVFLQTLHLMFIFFRSDPTLVQYQHVLLKTTFLRPSFLLKIQQLRLIFVYISIHVIEIHNSQMCNLCQFRRFSLHRSYILFCNLYVHYLFMYVDIIQTYVAFSVLCQHTYFSIKHTQLAHLMQMQCQSSLHQLLETYFIFLSKFYFQSIVVCQLVVSLDL